VTLTIVAFAIALFFAMNIGASGTAAAMGPAYGSGAIKTKRMAMILVAIFAFIGALAGGEVVKTIGGGIIPPSVVDVPVVTIILGAACLTLFIANMLGIPLSTSEVVVGSIVGAGIAFQAIFLDKLLIIVSFWVIVPIVAFGLALIVGKIIPSIQRKWQFFTGRGKSRKYLVLLLVV